MILQRSVMPLTRNGNHWSRRIGGDSGCGWGGSGGGYCWGCCSGWYCGITTTQRKSWATKIDCGRAVKNSSALFPVNQSQRSRGRWGQGWWSFLPRWRWRRRRWRSCGRWRRPFPPPSRALGLIFFAGTASVAAK